MRRFDATRAARVCFRGAAEIESSLKALADSERALLAADDEAGRAAAMALADAKAQLLAAKKALTEQAGVKSPLTVVP